jgi:Zn finger protein HypA/HybF involved in hydrogenase expression
MCSVGDLPEIDMEQAHKTLKPKNYECLDCGRKFKGIGENVKCISCRSGNVKEI